MKLNVFKYGKLMQSIETILIRSNETMIIRSENTLEIESVNNAAACGCLPLPRETRVSIVLIYIRTGEHVTIHIAQENRCIS